MIEVGQKVLVTINSRKIEGVVTASAPSIETARVKFPGRGEFLYLWNAIKVIE